MQIQKAISFFNVYSSLLLSINIAFVIKVSVSQKLTIVKAIKFEKIFNIEVFYIKPIVFASILQPVITYVGISRFLF